MVANQVRLLLFVLAYNLGNFLRRLGLPKSIEDSSFYSLQMKLIEIGVGLYSMLAGWCSSWPRWLCRKCCSRLC